MIKIANVSQFDLSGYFSDGREIIRNYNGQEYHIQKYQNPHNQEYTVMQFKDGVANGTAQLFERGIIKLSWIMKNGVRDGALTVYNNGVVDYVTSWDSMDCKSGKDKAVNIRKVVNHDCGKRQLVITMADSEVIVYKGEFNPETLMREGWGFAYDEEEGVEKHYGYFIQDQLVHIKQEFIEDPSQSNGQRRMIEYSGPEDDQNAKEILNRRPIYSGGYIFDDDKQVFVRHGNGYVINELSGICDRLSEWEKGEEVKDRNRLLYGGWFDEGDSCQSIRMSVIDENEKKRREEEEEERRMNESISLCDGLQFTQIRGLETLITQSSQYNGNCSDISKMELKLIDMPRLKRIEIGSSCFQNTRGFILENLNCLEEVKVGEHCFRFKYGSNLYQKSDERNDGIFRIVNCPKLRTLQLGDNSFCDFKTFHISNVNSLSSIDFGKCCFVFSDFSLKGNYKNERR